LNHPVHNHKNVNIKFHYYLLNAKYKCLKTFRVNWSSKNVSNRKTAIRVIREYQNQRKPVLRRYISNCQNTAHSVLVRSKHDYSTVSDAMNITAHKWRSNTGLFEMIVGVLTICHLVHQMQPHVISFYGVTSRIRFMFLLFPQVSRN